MSLSLKKQGEIVNKSICKSGPWPAGDANGNANVVLVQVMRIPRATLNRSEPNERFKFPALNRNINLALSDISPGSSVILVTVRITHFYFIFILFFALVKGVNGYLCFRAEWLKG